MGFWRGLARVVPAGRQVHFLVPFWARFGTIRFSQCSHYGSDTILFAVLLKAGYHMSSCVVDESKLNKHGYYFLQALCS